MTKGTAKGWTMLGIFIRRHKHITWNWEQHEQKQKKKHQRTESIERIESVRKQFLLEQNCNRWMQDERNKRKMKKEKSDKRGIGATGGMWTQQIKSWERKKEIPSDKMKYFLFYLYEKGFPLWMEYMRSRPFSQLFSW